MREATESAGQFFAVLNDLIRAGNDDALLTFLSLCDISLMNLPRSSVRRTRPVWKGQEGMRQLGERNLQICRNLHSAIRGFFERHAKKLKRHAESLALDGASNFLHIFLTMGGLLRWQVEGLVIALEAHQRDISPQEWSQFRAFWDVYFLMFSNLMECLWDDYVKPLGGARNRKDIEQEFGPDLDAIHELCDSMILYRERIERVRNEKCLRREPGGRKIPIGSFHLVLGPVNWQRYAIAVQTRQVNVERAVLGHMDHHVPEIHVQPRLGHI